MPKRQRVSIVLRTLTVASIVAAGGLLFRLPRQGVAESSAASPIAQQATPVKIDLGNGFSATTDGSATVVTTPCQGGFLRQNTFEWSPPLIGSTSLIGPLTGSTYRFEANAVGKVYGLSCDAKADNISSGLPTTSASQCLALSRQDNAVKPNSIACTIDTWRLGEGDMYRPEIRFATVAGATTLTDGLGGDLGLAGCDFGDRVTLSLDGQPIVTENSIRGTDQTAAGGTAKFILPALQSGTHKVEANCTYSAANTPKIAEMGGCISFVVENGTITKLDNCSSQSEVGTFNRQFILDNQLLEGACGGYGFSAQTTTKDGRATGLVAVAGANQGDRATVPTSVMAVPADFWVASCWTDMAGKQAGPLRCYVLEYGGLKPTNESATCPFKSIRSVDTL